MNNTTFPGVTWHIAHSGGICSLTSRAAIAVYAFFLISLSIIATVENLLLLIILCRYQALRIPSMALYGILAIVDLLMGVLITPTKAYVTLANGASYRHWSALFAVLIILSLSTVVLISSDRFFRVYYLEGYEAKKKKLYLAYLAFWMVPSLLGLLIFLGVIGMHGGVAFIFLLSGMIVMVVAGVAMTLTLRKHVTLTDAVREACSRNQREIVNTTLLLVAVFIIMNLPPIFTYVVGYNATTHSRGWCAFTFFSVLANSAVNPVIYFLRIPSIRKHTLMFFHLERFTSTETRTVDECQEPSRKVSFTVIEAPDVNDNSDESGDVPFTIADDVVVNEHVDTDKPESRQSPDIAPWSDVEDVSNDRNDGGIVPLSDATNGDGEDQTDQNGDIVPLPGEEGVKSGDNPEADDTVEDGHIVPLDDVA